MIEFCGKLSEKSIEYLTKDVMKGTWLIALFAVVFVSLPVIMLGIFCYKLLLLFLLVPVVIGIACPIGTKKDIITNIPYRIVIEENLITLSTEKEEEKSVRETTDIIEIVDTGELYQFKFCFGHKSSFYVCQKDLITKGSLAEFEEMFADKLVEN